MLIVTGTKRSGTSLWMQLLIEAGFKHAGTKWPRNWEEKLKAANPRGFYESELRKGIYWETNPHPETGSYLHPKATRKMLVKVFIPGLVRSDVAFLNRVVATIRPWREVVRSLRRMRKLESEVFDWPSREKQPHWMPPEVEWLRENFLLVRDLRVRGYPHRVVPHSHLMTRPEQTLHEVLQFLGADTSLAPSLASRIDPELYRNRAPAQSTSSLPEEAISRLDLWQHHVDRGAWDDLEGLTALNEVWTMGLEQGWFDERLPWDHPRVAGE